MTPKRGRPPVDEKATFRNVAVPIEVYEMIRELAGVEDRTIARQLSVLIKQAYLAHKNPTDLDIKLGGLNVR
tara:strand:- start:170 stop:385 length:216 start_codon:yes stop_codon:yes gene_type:complete